MLKPWRHWFNGRAAVSRLPQECIEDCSAPGPVDDACDYWCKRLNFEAPPWLLREHLKSYGPWNQADLCDHQQNLKRLLWIWACDCHDSNDPDYLPYLSY